MDERERNECEACGTEENEVPWLMGEVARLKAETARLAEALAYLQQFHDDYAEHTQLDVRLSIEHLNAVEAERDAAQARAAELERENAQLLDTAAKVEIAADGHLEHCSCSQSVALLAARAERLAGDLAKYGAHSLECEDGILGDVIRLKPVKPTCICGLSAALGLAGGEGGG